MPSPSATSDLTSVGFHPYREGSHSRPEESAAWGCRLEHVAQMGEVALEMSTTAEDAASTFIPLCQQLARDPEPRVRQSAVEQIAPLVRALAAVSTVRGPRESL